MGAQILYRRPNSRGTITLMGIQSIVNIHNINSITVIVTLEDSVKDDESDSTYVETSPLRLHLH
jgi:hypothetical protein